MKYIISIVLVLFTITPCFGERIKMEILQGQVMPGPGMQSVMVVTLNGRIMVQLYGVYIPQNKAAEAQHFLIEKYKNKLNSTVRLTTSVYGTKMSVDGQDLAKVLNQRGYAIKDGVCQQSQDPYCNQLH